MSESCPFTWGGYHWCSLPRDGHMIHQCGSDLHRCCQYDPGEGMIRYSINDGPWGDWLVAAFANYYQEEE